MTKKSHFEKNCKKCPPQGMIPFFRNFCSFAMTQIPIDVEKLSCILSQYWAILDQNSKFLSVIKFRYSTNFWVHVHFLQLKIKLPLVEPTITQVGTTQVKMHSIH